MRKRELEFVRAALSMEGSRCVFVETGPIQASLSAIARLPFGVREDEAARIRGLLALQKADGGFPTTPGGSSSRDATRLARLALRLFAEESVSHGTVLGAEVVRAIEACGEFLSTDAGETTLVYRLLVDLVSDVHDPGAARTRGFAWLAAVGLLLTGPVGARFWSRWLSAYAQGVLPAIGILLDPIANRSRLWRWIRAMLSVVGLHNRARRLARLGTQLEARQSSGGGWSWTVLGTHLSLVAAHVLGQDARAGSIRRGIGYLESVEQKSGDQSQPAWGATRVWDLAIAADFLLQSDADRDMLLEMAQRLVRYQKPSGLTPFDPGIDLGDHDSTAVALRFVAGCLPFASEEQRRALVRFVQTAARALEEVQHADGGWGFAPGFGGPPFMRLGRRPPGAVRATLIDASAPDLTARVALGLATAWRSGALSSGGRENVERALRRARRYFERSQLPDGGWWGRWTAGTLVPTASVLLALRALGVPAHADVVRRGRERVANLQDEDGGFDDPWLGERGHEAELTAAGVVSMVAAHTEHQGEQQGISTLGTEPWFPQKLEAALAYLRGLRDTNGGWDVGPLHVVIPGAERFAAQFYGNVEIVSALRLGERALVRGCPIALARRFRPVAIPRRPAGAAAGVQALHLAHSRLVEQARELAGAPGDIPQRVSAHLAVYRDSGGSFTFPLLALHGAAWADGHFRRLEPLIPLYVRMRHPFSHQRRHRKLAAVRRAMTGFKQANRKVLIDVFVNYHFARDFGRQPKADRLLREPLLGLLNHMHDAIAVGAPLDENEKEQIWRETFEWEQANSVWPMVRRTIQLMEDRIVRFFAFKPIVRFAYFPRFRFLFFQDFSKTEERIEEGFRAYDIAQDVGWRVTEMSVRKYPFVNGGRLSSAVGFSR